MPRQSTQTLVHTETVEKIHQAAEIVGDAMNGDETDERLRELAFDHVLGRLLDGEYEDDREDEDEGEGEEEEPEAEEHEEEAEEEAPAQRGRQRRQRTAAKK